MSDINNNDYPGYPHRPPGEDITRNNEKVSPDTEGKPQSTQNAPADNSENDINAEDLAALEQEDQNIVATRLDDTDDDGTPLNEETDNKDIGADLDVPGSELDDDNEAVGEEDEENNYYSLGDNDTTEDTEGIP